MMNRMFNKVNNYVEANIFVGYFVAATVRFEKPWHTFNFTNFISEIYSLGKPKILIN